MGFKRILLFIISAISVGLSAQFAPAAGQVGSDAIKADSSCFVAWATSGTVNLGLRDVSQPDSGFAAVGLVANALGPAMRNGVISLGDGGRITLYFESGIINGPGFDFAVFENAFNDSFLELAHVEISENGTDFFTLPSISLSQTETQTPSFGSTYATKIQNLAGKYRMPYGTPFDIESLDSIEPNLPSVFYYVRLVDVVGSIHPLLGSFDSRGNIINDPWPTPFISSGFDLDAIGVIHAFRNSRTQEVMSTAFRIFPQDNGLRIEHPNTLPYFQILDFSGKIWYTHMHPNQGPSIWLDSVPPGLYILQSAQGAERFYVP